MKIWSTDKGNFSKTLKFLNNSTKVSEKIILNAAERGVEALAKATPKESGLAASSWGYTIEKNNGRMSIIFHNYDIEGGYNVAILLQYGHGTGTGGYVKGIDYINPALKPIFDNIANDIWEEMNR